MVTAEVASADARAPTFFGHPKNLFHLALAEAQERFSYYGLRL